MIECIVDTAVVVPVNFMPLLDSTDFISIEPAVVYNSAGMDLVWNFVPASTGVAAGTAVTPTTAGNYDWTEQVSNKGMYSIEIPASGGASINNDTEGVGWFTGVATGILPWAGPLIRFRPALVVNSLVTGSDRLQVDALEISSDSTAADNLELACDNYSATRGLSGTALPAAAADAAGGLPISDAGGLDLDTKLANTNEITAARMGALTDWINGGRLDLILDIIAADTTTDIPALIATLQAFVDTEVAAILADTNELQTDWANGGRLDLILDIIAADTTTDIPALIADLPTNSELATALAAADDAILSALAVVDGNVDDVETLLGAVAVDVASVLDDTGTAGVVVAAASKTGYALSAAGIDSIWDEVMEGAYTARQYMRVYASALAAKLSGAATTTVAIRDTADTKDRVTATVDADGNRSAVTLDVS